MYTITSLVNVQQIFVCWNMPFGKQNLACNFRSYKIVKSHNKFLKLKDAAKPIGIAALATNF